MLEGIPEGRCRLPGQRAPGCIRNGAGNHDWQAAPQILEEFLHGKHRRLGVQRIEHRFDQQQIGATFHQCLGRLVIVLSQGIETDAAETGVIHIWRNRQGTRGRPDDAGTETGLGRILRGQLVAQLTHQAGACHIQLIGYVLQSVFGLGDARGIEGTGLDDVCTCLKILAMDLSHHIRAGEHQQIVITLEIPRMIGKTHATIVAFSEPVLLDHGTHAAIKDQDALGEQGFEFGSTVGLHRELWELWGHRGSPVSQHRCI